MVVDLTGLDLDDATVIENLVNLVTHISQEDEEFMEILKHRLPLMELQIPQPPKEEWLVTKPKQNPDDGSKNYKHGKFLKDESDLVEKNWLKFAKKFHIPNEPERLARVKNPRCRRRKLEYIQVMRIRVYITAYLSRGLKRHLYQVYNHFIMKYAYQVKGPYSNNENKIVNYFAQHFEMSEATKYLTIILSRRPRQINNKLHGIVSGLPKSIPRKKWTLDRATRFLKRLMRYTGLELRELKDRKIETDVWLKIAKKCKNNIVNLRRFWFAKLHVQLFAEKEIKLRKIRKKVLEKLGASSYKVWSDIDWKAVAQGFPEGITPMFLYYVSVRSFLKCRGLLQGPLKVAIDYAMSKNCMKKRVKRLRLNDEGRLELIPPNNSSGS